MNENLKEEKKDLQITPNVYAASWVGIVFGDLNNVYICDFPFHAVMEQCKSQPLEGKNGKTNIYFISILENYYYYEPHLFQRPSC